METKISFIQILFCVLLWMFLYLYSKYLYRKKYNLKKVSYKLYLLLMILFSTFAYYSGDYLNYKSLYERSIINPQYMYNVESVYLWLIANLPNNFSLWRLVVWGFAAFIWILIYKRLKIQAKYACLPTTLVLMFSFPNFRQSLAIAIFFYAATFILCPLKKNRIFSYLIAFLFACISLSFHKTTLMCILLFMLSFIPFSKLLIVCSLFAFPFLYGAIMVYAGEILGLVFAEESQGSYFGTYYLESEKGEINLGGLLQMVVTRGPIIVSVLYSFWLIYFKKKEVSRIIKPFLKYTYLLLYIGMLFFEQSTSSFLSSRFLDITCYPLTIYLAYCLNYQKDFLAQNKILNLFLWSNIYLWSYSLYLKL